MPETNQREGLEESLKKIMPILTEGINKNENLCCTTVDFFEQFCRLRFQRKAANKLSIFKQDNGKWEARRFVDAFEHCLSCALQKNGFDVAKNPSFDSGGGHTKTGDLLVFKKAALPEPTVIFVEIKSTIEWNPMAAAIFQGLLLLQASVLQAKLDRNEIHIKQSKKKYAILSLYANQKKSVLKDLLNIGNNLDNRDIEWTNFGYFREDFEHNEPIKTKIQDNIAAVDRMFRCWHSFLQVSKPDKNKSKIGGAQGGLHSPAPRG